MSKMTVLQKIINYYQASLDRCDEDHCDICDADKKVIEKLKSYLPAEEQQIRDAAEAGYNWRRHKGKASKEDIETYIKTLTTQP